MQSVTEKTTSSKSQKGVGDIGLLPAIKPKGATINVKNKDNRSFDYAILSALYHNKI